jgi:uncharacterized protein (TIGR02996 family)
VTTEADFDEAILADPADVSRRLVYADWLEEQGDPRAELFRLQNTLTQSVDAPNRTALETLQQHLLDVGVPPAAIITTNSLGMKFSLIPPGELWMGSPVGEKGRSDDENLHLVAITEPFFLGMFTVTQGEFAQLMHDNPSTFTTTRRHAFYSMHDVGDTSLFPVETVSWYSAIEFANELSLYDGYMPYYQFRDVKRGADGWIDQAEVLVQGGNGYRLPTEAEWEYSCRAGTGTPFHFGASLTVSDANIGDCPNGDPATGPFLRRAAAVGSYRPNAFGLFDMHGNVWEWCEDWYNHSGANGVAVAQSEARVARGGSWFYDANYCRSAVRFRYVPHYCYRDQGFRVARSC